MSQNVLLVVLDSVRAASTSLLGYDRETTPFLSRFAAESTTYTQARAPSNWSLPSHASMLTGLGAAEHGVTTGSRQLKPGNTVFEELAGQHGYDTGAFSENVYLTEHRSNLAEAFETVEGRPDDHPAEYEKPTGLGAGPDGRYYVDRFLDWVDDRERDWAACVNLMDAHRPYEPREAFDEWSDETCWDAQADLGAKWEWPFHGEERSDWELAALERLYEGAIRQTDAMVRDLVAGLRERDAFEDALVVICGDHGEGFGEAPAVPGGPRGLAHGLGVNESVLHVPLLVNAPGQSRTVTVRAPATLQGFPEAVRTLALGDAAPDLGSFCPDDGVVRSYCPPISDRMEDRLEPRVDDLQPYAGEGFVEYEQRGDGVEKRAVWCGATRRTMEFDPWNTRDCGTVDPEQVRAGFATTRDQAVGGRCGPGVDAAVEDRLRDLGYF